jgi:isoquinoline 1-oxidoreductase beta subunit
MNQMLKATTFAPSRREFMVGVAGLTFAIVTGNATESAIAAAPAAAAQGKALSPWVSIATDGTISIMSPATEMGQGSTTSLPLIIAEEMDADWNKVAIVPAPVVEKIYGNPGFGGLMYTAGSNAVRSYYKPLRIFGAQVRHVLLENAAKHWDVPVAELTTEPSVVVHAKSGRRMNYGEVAGIAELPASAPEIKPEDLKKPEAFRLIGKDVLRAELPNKVNGTAKYSIDVQVPGMFYGAVLRSPVEGRGPHSMPSRRSSGPSSGTAPEPHGASTATKAWMPLPRMHAIWRCRSPRTGSSRAMPKVNSARP